VDGGDRRRLDVRRRVMMDWRGVDERDEERQPVKMQRTEDATGMVSDRRQAGAAPTAGQAAVARIRVPEGMLEAVRAEIRGGISGVEGILRTALEWLSEHPIRPTPLQVQRMIDYANANLSSSFPAVEDYCVEWQRLMFVVKPESAVCQRVREAVAGQRLSEDEAARLHEVIDRAAGAAAGSAAGSATEGGK
jgi:hypothetical protein